MALLALLAGCGTAFLLDVDKYPLPDEPPAEHVYTPAAVGQAVQAVVIYLRPHNGDTIELLDAVAIGKVTGADIAMYLSRPVAKPSGEVVIGEQLEPLAGATITRTSPSTGPETQFGIVAEVTPQTEGRFEITDVRLSYRINDGIAETGNGITQTFTVCAGATTCEAE